jgi:hypothetical protein
MITFTGQTVNPTGVTDEQIRIEDIAHALALTNRFGGHTPVPISVAQHSVFVSTLCSKQESLRGLLHDASEAYLGDVVRPLKHSPKMRDYLVLEEALQTRILEKYGCAGEGSYGVNQADELALQVEMVVSFSESTWFFTPTPEALWMAKSYTIWPWQRAERSFLERFQALCALPTA